MNKFFLALALSSLISAPSFACVINMSKSVPLKIEVSNSVDFFQRETALRIVGDSGICSQILEDADDRKIKRVLITSMQGYDAVNFVREHLRCTRIEYTVQYSYNAERKTLAACLQGSIDRRMHGDWSVVDGPTDLE